MARNSSRVGPRYPQVVVLFGATGDLARRKLLPGLFHLASAGFIPGLRIVGVSLDEIDSDAFRGMSRKAMEQFFSRKLGEADWAAFAERIDYVPLAAGAAALKAKMSLSFYGKRPGPGMRLDKLSLQFAMHDTGWIGDVLEAYERLILDAMRGDHTLFTTAQGIERLWELSIPLLEAPRPCASTSRAPGGRSRSTSSWHPTPGGCRSSGLGGRGTTLPDGRRQR